ncbi:choice-of-anchor L domain-containing protein, partial [Flavobacterium sp.]|uniref:choice-of-anchor L domain-containing protein n=1 Tax=Flavobacterium sp. TaxID=239 RepID=UPI00121A59D9
MKKITFFLVLLLLGFTGFSQIHETFDDASVTAPTALGPWTLPSGAWRIADNGVGTTNWTISSTSVYPAYSNPNAAYINRQNIGAGNVSQDYLISPAFPLPANPQMRFQSRTTLAGFQNTVFEVRAALGTSDPTNLANFTYLLGTWNDDVINSVFDQYEQKVIDLPDFGGATTIYIAFVKITTQTGAAQTGERWLVDDVHVDQKCNDSEVETLDSSASTASSITLDWDAAGNNQWEVLVLPAGVPLANAGTPIVVNGLPTVTVTSTTETVPAPFTALTCYVYYVRSICFFPGEWVGPSDPVCTQALPPVCGGNYVDSGGVDGNYSNNESSTITICPQNAGDVVTVTFTAFSVESNWDGMYVYDGNGTNDPLIPSTNGPGNGDLTTPGAYWGNSIPGPFESSSADGCLTFQFISDGFQNQAGWAANVTCGPAPTCPKPTALTGLSATDQSVTLSWTPVGPGTTFEVLALPTGSPAPGANATGIQTTSTTFTYPGLASATCFDFYVRTRCSDTDISSWSFKITYCTQITPPVCGGVFTDTGGPNANYPNNSNSVVSICPQTPGEIVTVTFTSFSVESTWDGLYIHDGDSLNDPLIPSNNGPGNNGNLSTPGAYWGTANPGTFEASSADGCLTFQFFSDGFGNEPGWSATVNCGPPPTCPKPTAVTLGTPTATEIPVSWTAVGPATTWHVYAVPCGSTPPSATDPDFVTANATSVTLTNLDSATCYDIYVFAICSPTDVSSPAGPRTATTLVAPPVCGGFFIDQGGPANYPNQSNSVVTICPENTGDQVTVTFTMFNTEENWDGIYVFDGDSVNSPMIASDNPAGFGPLTEPGAYWGNTIPGPFTSSAANGCLTFWFLSDFSFNEEGWLANVACLPPPTCPKPTAVTIADTSATTVTVSWTEVGSATQWHVLVLPATAPVPDANTPGWEVANATTYTYGNITPLTAATQYKVYVRAFCSADDISLWSNPKSFSTAPENDECTAAVVVPVNPGVPCVDSVSGTLIGATGSTQANTCTGTADDDVWFQFTALTTAQAITLSNIQGNAFSLNMAVYQGDCAGGLTLVECSETFTDQMTVSPLVPNQIYYVRVWTETATPNQNSTFDLCITTVPPPIYTSITDYTIEELVTDILINSDCASVTNITYSTGTNFGSTPGIGYFGQNGSSFPFQEGLIMTTGHVLNAPGPNLNVLDDGNAEMDTWGGDDDLENIVFQGTGQTMISYNASILEFDFIPITPTISFNFLFASEEYGIFQCDYSDAFAFLLTDTATNTTTNLAVIPSTNTPVSVITIRDTAYNGGCGSVNPQYFDEYYLLPEGADPLSAPINYNGVTVPLTATSTVTPGTQYHIKLVIADRLDGNYDSAVFLQGGSFNIGDIQLGQDFLEADGTALCSGSSFVLDSGLDPTLYTFQWTQDGEIIPGATGATITVTESGDYGATATYNNSTCSATDSVTIEFYPPLQPGTPQNLVACNSTGFAQFTLSDADAPILGGLNPAIYSVTYYFSEADANGQVNPLPNIYTNVVQYDQTIWANLHTPSGCFAVVSLHLIVQDLAPVFTVTPDFSMCAGAAGTITVTPGNFDPASVTYSWTLGADPLPDTTQTISVTQAGTYTVTVNNAGCTGSASTVVTLTPGPVAPPDVTVCDSYILPTLPSAGNYFTQSGGLGTPLFAGDVVNQTQTIYVYSASCPNEDSFVVTITTLSAFVPTITDGCSQYVLPDPGTNNTYYTAPGGPTGGGTVLNAGDVITQDGTIVYVYANDGICTAESNFTVTIGNITAITMPDVTNCGPYTLPALPANHTYNTASDCSGTVLAPGSTINATQIVYVCAVLGTCSDTSEFLVTIYDQPTVGTFQPVVECNSYTLPTLTSGGYFSQTGGVDPITNLTLGVGTYTVYVYVAPVAGSPCTAVETSFTVAVSATPTADVLPDVTNCEGVCFTLPALTPGNTYWSNGTQLNAGDQVCQTSTITIRAVSPDNAQCFTESTFTVTVGDAPQFTIDGGCQNNVYVLTATAVNYDAATASYAWSTTDGQIVSGGSTASATVSGAGTYTLTVTVSGCDGSAPFVAATTSCTIQKGISANNDGV